MFNGDSLISFRLTAFVCEGSKPAQARKLQITSAETSWPLFNLPMTHGGVVQRLFEIRAWTVWNGPTLVLLRLDGTACKDELVLTGGPLETQHRHTSACVC